MTDFRHQYKQNVFGFRNVTESRLIRAEKHDASRKNQRNKTFNRNRNISESATNSPQSREVQLPLTRENRLNTLMRWKAERDRRKKLEQIRKRPPFKVGVVHHKVYSPINKDTVTVPIQTREKPSNHVGPQANPAKRITRATEKRLKAKAAAAATVSAVSKKVITKASTKNAMTTKEQKEREKSFAPIDHKFKAPVGLPQVPLFGRIPLETSSKDEINNFILSPLNKSSPKQNRNSQKWTTNQINVKESKSPEHIEMKEEDVNNTTADTSIETVSLKLSSDEQETFNTSSESRRQLRKSSTPNNNNNKRTPPSCLNQTIPPSTQSNLSSEPVFFSPYIVSSRGKSSARKEQQLRRGIGLSPSEDIPTKETIMKNLNVSVEEEERTAQYFQFILNREIERLNDLCNKWIEIKSESDVTEDAQYQINQAIGQTTLLMNKKFERFRRLVNDCETGKGEMLVTCKDLQGFWDMMYMEVIDCNSRFEKLEKLRANKWEEEQPVLVKPVPKKKAAVKKKVVPAKHSSIRSLILLERKKKMAQKNLDGTEEVTIKQASYEKISETKSSPTRQSIRRSKSFTPCETKSTPAKSEGIRLSLLQKVQLSETSKRLNSPLTIMKISQMCKTPEVQLDNTISYVNSDQTPAKSILKRTKDSIDSESRTKSVHKVNFDVKVVLNEVPIDEEAKRKSDLAVALARIESFDFDSAREQSTVNAERRLTFDDSSDESQTASDNIENQTSETQDSKLSNKSCMEVPSIQIKFATPLRESLSDNSSSAKSSRRSLRRQSTIHEGIKKPVNIAVSDDMVTTDDEPSEDTPRVSKRVLRKQVSLHDEQESNGMNESIKILRNRTITSKDTPKSKRRSSKVSMSVQEVEHKENKSPLKTTRRSNLKDTNKDEKKKSIKVDLVNQIDKISLDENDDKRRRSSRKSVKFSTKDCSGCVESGPVLPMTPHIRRSKARSSEGKRRSTLAEESGSWEISEKPPERIRRSQSKKL